MKKVFFAYTLFFLTLCHAQTSKRLDSLKTILQTQMGIDRIKTVNEISWEFKNIHADSALAYAKYSLRLSEVLKEKKIIAASYHNIASAYEAKSNLDSAAYYYQKSLKIKLKTKDSIGIADTYNNLGILEDNKGNYKEALANYFRALKIYENHELKLNDFEKVPMVLVNIGIIYKRQKDYTKVLDYYNKALKIYRDNNFKIGEAIITGNIGSILINLQDYNSSIQYSEKGERIYDSLGYKRYIPYMKVNKAIALDSLKMYAKAQENYITSITMFNDDENYYELSHTYISFANSLTKRGKLNAAQENIFKAIKIINQNGYKEFKSKALKYLSIIQFRKGEFNNAYKTLNNHLNLKDSLYNSDKSKIIYELETKYKTEKKEKDILEQRAELAEKELNLNRKNTQLIGLGVVAILLSILGYLLYKQQKIKNRQFKKEAELKEALVRIETQNKLQEQRLRISRDLHDNIGAQLTFIISSIENLQYGFKIKSDKLTNKLKGISAFTKDTIYELRDTIWAMNKNEISLEDLEVRISNFIEKADENTKDISFKFEIGEKSLKDTTFSSVKGMNIYRIIQEAVNNAFKYAEPKTISVHISENNSSLNFEIKDDGKGFDFKTIEKGNGLNNIKKRADDINALIKIKSEIGKGTSIKLSSLT